jgi:hypothetical protein
MNLDSRSERVPDAVPSSKAAKQNGQPSGGRRFAWRFALLLAGLSLSLAACAPAAWAASVPAPSPGAPFSPYNGALGDPLLMLLPAFEGAVVLAVMVLIMALSSRRRVDASAPASSAGQRTTPEERVGRRAAGGTPLQGPVQYRQKTPRRAA